MKIRLKRKKNLQIHWEWLNKQFSYDWNPWEWFKSKAIGFHTSRRREKMILQHVNGRSNVAKSVKTYLETLKWEVLPHPPYGLAHHHFRSYEEVKKWIDSRIASKDASFFRDGIRKLPERWEKVVISDGLLIYNFIILWLNLWVCNQNYIHFEYRVIKKIEKKRKV